MGEYILSATLGGHKYGVRALAVWNDDLLATLEEQGITELWRREGTNVFTKVSGWTSKENNQFHDKGKLAFCLEVLRGSQYPDHSFISGAGDKAARPFNDKGIEMSALIGHTNVVNSITQTASGRIVTGSWDGTARIWDGVDTKIVLRGHEHGTEVLGLPNGDIVTASTNKSIIIFSAEGSIKRQLPGAHNGPIRCLAYHPLGFVSCGNDGFAKIWSLEGNLLVSIASHVKSEVTFVYGVSALPSGEVAVCGEDGFVRVWSQDGQTLLQEIRHPGPVRAVKALSNGVIFRYKNKN